MAPKVVADMKMKGMVHIYAISDLLFLIREFEVAPLEKHVYPANPVKMTKPNSGCFPDGYILMEQGSDGVSSSN